MVVLDLESVKSMAPGQFFRHHKGAVNSLDFHHTEDVMVTVGASTRAHAVLHAFTGRLALAVSWRGARRVSVAVVYGAHLGSRAMHAKTQRTAGSRSL
jgi:COMPASS component SWD2